MKNKKLFLPAVIIAVAILATIVFSVITGIAMKPTITEGEFPFSITYELKGETVTINDVYKVRYSENGGYADTKSRIYEGEIGNMGEGTNFYTLKEDNEGKIVLYTQFYPDYMMGDSWYEYFDEEPFSPQIFYYDSEGQEYGDEETLSAQGVKLVSFEYPEPIENSFTFSHISYLSGEVVLPITLIALIALFAIIIFVKKEKELKYKGIDTTTIVLNFVISFTFLPFVLIVALLIDIEGGSPEFYHQALYFVPFVSLLGIAASIALRRKGYGVKALIAELVGPAIFTIYLIVCGALGLL